MGLLKFTIGRGAIGYVGTQQAVDTCFVLLKRLVVCCDLISELHQVIQAKSNSSKALTGSIQSELGMSERTSSPVRL